MHYKENEFINNLFIKIKDEKLNYNTPYKFNIKNNFEGHINFTTEKNYLGNNLLDLSSIINNYSSNAWAGFEQFAALNILINKGEKGTPLLIPIIKKELVDGVEKDVIKNYVTKHVFNIEQTNLNIETINKLKPNLFNFNNNIIDNSIINTDTINKNEKFIDDFFKKNTELKLNFVKNDFINKAAFSSNNIITISNKENFKNPSEYYATLYHEMAHFMVQKLYLRKDIETKFGNKAYNQEEFIAELSSVLISKKMDILDTTKLNNSSAYIQGWIKNIDKNDINIFTYALENANKITNNILNTKIETIKIIEPNVIKEQNKLNLQTETFKKSFENVKFMDMDTLYKLNSKIDLNDVMSAIGATHLKKKSNTRYNNYSINGNRYCIYNNNNSIAQDFYIGKPVNAFQILLDNKIINNSNDFKIFIETKLSNIKPDNTLNFNNSTQQYKTFDIAEYRILNAGEVTNNYLTNKRSISKDILKSSEFENIIKFGNKKQYGYNQVLFLYTDKENIIKDIQMVNALALPGQNKYFRSGANPENYLIKTNNPNANKIMLFESGIDLISYRQLNANINNEQLIAFGGFPSKKQALEIGNIANYQNIKHICFCFDNDMGGEKISNFVKDNLRNKDFNFNEIKPTLGKDWNENLKLNQVNNIKLGIGI